MELKTHKNSMMINRIIIFFIIILTGIVYLRDRYNDNELEQYCVAQYKMNDNTGSATVIDSKAYSNGIAQQNTSALHTTGKIGGALSFNGTSDYIDANDTFESVFQSSFTINLWCKPTDGQPSASQYLLGLEDLGPSMYIDIKLSTTGSFVCDYENVYSWVRAESSSSLSDGQQDWIMITMVVKEVSETTAKIVFYKNDSLDKDGDIRTINLNDYDCDYNIFIGNFNDNGEPDSYFAGSLDNVMIFNKALSSIEIQELYNNGKGRESFDSTSRGRRQ